MKTYFCSRQFKDNNLTIFRQCLFYPITKMKRKLIVNIILRGSSGRISNNKLSPNDVEWWWFGVLSNTIYQCPVLNQR